MSGDAPPHVELNELKQRYGFRILLDQAHSFGVLGEDGRDRDVDYDLRMICFSKWSGLFGGAIVGPRAPVGAARDGSAPESVAYPACALGPLHDAIGAIEDGTVAVNAAIVRERSDYLWLRLRSSGWGARHSAPRGAHIICVTIGVMHMTCALQQWCIRRGVYVAVVAYPAIASRIKMGLRLCVTASMTTQQIEKVVATMDAFALGSLMAPAIPSSPTPPAPTRCAGLRAVRNLGGNCVGYRRLEHEAATRCGYDVCVITNTFAYDADQWRKTFRRICDVQDVKCLDTEADLLALPGGRRPAVALIPMRPFGCMMMCGWREWGPEMRVRHPGVVFTTSPPPYIYDAPDSVADHKHHITF